MLLALEDDVLMCVLVSAIRSDEVVARRCGQTNHVYMMLRMVCRRLRSLVLGGSGCIGSVSIKIGRMPVSSVLQFLASVRCGGSFMLWSCPNRHVVAACERVDTVRCSYDMPQPWSYREFYWVSRRGFDRLDPCRGSCVDSLSVRRVVRLVPTVAFPMSIDEYVQLRQTSVVSPLALTVSSVLVGRMNLSIGCSVPAAVERMAMGGDSYNKCLDEVRHLHVVPLGERELMRRTAVGRVQSVLRVVEALNTLIAVTRFTLVFCRKLSWLNLDASLCDDATCSSVLARIGLTVPLLCSVLYERRGLVTCGYGNRLEFVSAGSDPGGLRVCRLRLVISVSLCRRGFFFSRSFFEKLSVLLDEEHVVGNERLVFRVDSLSLVFEVRSLCGLIDEDVYKSLMSGVMVDSCRRLVSIASRSVRALKLVLNGEPKGSLVIVALKSLMMRVFVDACFPRLVRVDSNSGCLANCIWYLRMSLVVSLRVTCDSVAGEAGATLLHALGMWWGGLETLDVVGTGKVRESVQELADKVVLYVSSLPLLRTLRMTLCRRVLRGVDFGKVIQQQLRKAGMGNRRVEVILVDRDGLAALSFWIGDGL